MKKIIEITDIYFLILMAVSTLIVMIKDSKDFAKQNKSFQSKLAKYLSLVLLIVSVLMFVVSNFVLQ